MEELGAFHMSELNVIYFGTQEASWDVQSEFLHDLIAACHIWHLFVIFDTTCQIWQFFYQKI